MPVAEQQQRRELTSPSALLSCVLAAVTNNNEALLFEPEKNAYKGVWKEVSTVDNFQHARLTASPLAVVRPHLAPHQAHHHGYGCTNTSQGCRY